MKKIIAAFDGLSYSTSVEEYAVAIAKENNYQLLGVFLEDVTYHSYRLYETVKGGKQVELDFNKLEDHDKKLRNASVKKFEKTCDEAGISFSIHRNKSIALQELLHESIYADLLIIDGKETFTHYEEEKPTRFIRDLLSDVQCPVLLAPQQFNPIKKISLLYDGEPSSVHAIKMFSYLLPLFKNLSTEVITVKSLNKDLRIPDDKLMKEFMRNHYPKATYTVLNGFAEIEISDHLKKQKGNSLIILGAYRRGAVSRWFRESMADILMKELDNPLFIAHNK